MGKSESDKYDPESIATPKMTSIFYTPLEDDDEEERGEPGLGNSVMKLPFKLSAFAHQVAGHVTDGQNFGMAKFKDTLLKPSPKAVNFEREVHFYESLQRSANDCSCNLNYMIKGLVPKYFGNTAIQMEGVITQCLMLEDLTRGMKEPCIMDVKIGKRTWDPESTMDKIDKEEAKYVETKREYGISITGLQVFNVKTGKKQKYDKSYGKQLTKDTVIDALKIFLNGVDRRISRVLLVQLLVNLWRIQHWARKQTLHRLFSSSILLIYDARRLRQLLNLNPPPEQLPPSSLRRSHSLYRPLSLAHLGNDKCAKTGFSGQLSKDGPIFPTRAKNKIESRPPPELASRRSAPNLKRMHSFHNNYDEELRSIRTDYTNILEDLVEDAGRNELWAMARMIDFAHVFPAEHARVDYNYLHGVESLIKLLEGFLMETEP